METYVPRNHITCLGLFPLHMFLLLDVELYDIQIIIVLSLGKQICYFSHCALKM